MRARVGKAFRLHRSTATSNSLSSIAANCMLWCFPVGASTVVGSLHPSGVLTPAAPCQPLRPSSARSPPRASVNRAGQALAEWDRGELLKCLTVTDEFTEKASRLRPWCGRRSAPRSCCTVRADARLVMLAAVLAWLRCGPPPLQTHGMIKLCDRFQCLIRLFHSFC